MNDLYLDNDFEAEFTVTRKNAATGATEAATGLTSLTVKISASDGGAAIGALTGSATERGTLGIYYYVFDGDALRTALAASYVGRRVWVVFGDGTNVLTSNPVVVRATRRAA